MHSRRRCTLAAVALALALAACSDTPSAPDADRAQATAGRQDRGASRVIPDRYIVVLEKDVRDAPGLARELPGAHGGTLHYTYQHAIKGFAATLPATAVEALRRNPNVAYVEQDQQVTLSQVVVPWGLDRVDQRDLPLNALYTFNKDGSGVRAYVIDTGIQTAHPEFGGRASVGYDAVGGNGQDCNGHGTHVAGTLGGANYGIARAVRLVAVRVFQCSGPSANSIIIAGVDWVRLNHIKPAVANMSLGGGASQALDDAVRNLIAAGVTVAVSAGNNNRADACNVSPARVAEAITVGSTRRNDVVSGFSNIGPCLDLFAPGDTILSAWLNSGSREISGTSMAAPHVAGTAALYLQGSPSASPATVRNAIVSTATPNRLSSIGTGSPNLLLHSLLGSPPPPPLSASLSGPTTINGTGPFTWTAVVSGGNGTYSYQWDFMATPLMYNNWVTVGNGPSYSRTFGPGATTFYLRLTVKSGGYTVSQQIMVRKES